MQVSDQQRSEAHAWLLRFHEANDALDAAAVGRFHAEGSVVRFGNADPIIGRSKIEEHFGNVFPLLEVMKHRVVRFDVLHDRIYQEASITYVIRGDEEKKEITISGLAVIGKRPNEEVMSFFDVYLDWSPVQERLQLVLAKLKTK